LHFVSLYYVKSVRVATAVKLFHQLCCQVVVKAYNQVQLELRPLACKAAATETAYIYYSRAIRISVVLALCAAAHPKKCCAGYARPRGFMTVCHAQPAADNVVTTL